MTVWLAEFCMSVYESSFKTISVHFTREGALAAIEKHKKGVGYNPEIKDWQVREIEVND